MVGVVDGAFKLADASGKFEIEVSEGVPAGVRASAAEWPTNYVGRILKVSTTGQNLRHARYAHFVTEKAEPDLLDASYKLGVDETGEELLWGVVKEGAEKVAGPHEDVRALLEEIPPENREAVFEAAQKWLNCPCQDCSGDMLEAKYKGTSLEEACDKADDIMVMQGALPEYAFARAYHWTVQGILHGFPECCIREFVDTNANLLEPSDARAAATHAGYMPCEEHARQLLATRGTLPDERMAA